MYYKEKKNKEELSIKGQIGKNLVDTTVKKLDDWVYKELEKLKYGEFPVCLNFNSTTLYIGGLFVKTINKNMYQVYDHEKNIHVFYSKYAAILYSLLMYTKHIKIGHAILKKDMQVAKNYDDIQYYTKMLAKMTKNKKIDEISVIDDKLYEARCRYNFNMEELEKTITYAKYMKVWEKLK